MLISENSLVKWNARIKKHYVDLGYEYTKMGDVFTVKTSHLTNGSEVIVNVSCDYCNKHYTKRWCNYILENKKSTIHKDCCKDCKKLKIQETVLEKYGVNSVFELDSIKEKIINTNLEKYGVENPFSSDEIKEKIYKTNIKRYGFKSPQKNNDIKLKTRNTCIEKYGVPSFVCTLSQFGEDNPRWKGGVKYHRQERSTSEYIEWRTGVYRKDDYTCQSCFSKSGNGKSVKLNAHHIKNWKDNPSDRYDISNGVTMCEECHLKFHSIYGKNNNNKSQIVEFFNHDKKIC